MGETIPDIRFGFYGHLVTGVPGLFEFLITRCRTAAYFHGKGVVTLLLVQNPAVFPLANFGLHLLESLHCAEPSE